MQAGDYCRINGEKAHKTHSQQDKKREKKTERKMS